MPPASVGCLRAVLRGQAAASPRRFLSDEATRVRLAALIAADAAPDAAERYRGKTVVLALPGQLAAAMALIALDGIARRLILWPPDVEAAQLAAIRAQAAVDAVITEWDLPSGDSQEPPAQIPGAGTAATRRAPSALATEWVLFTSGTTGRPKMVVHSLNSLAGHLPVASNPAATAPSCAGTVWCTFYDTRRYGGLQILLRALVGGGSLVLSCAGEAPSAFLARAAAAGATHFLGTPSHWRRALMTQAAQAIDPTYVRLSGEVADQMILDRLRAAYPRARIVHAFAATEAGLAFEVDDGLAGFPARLVGAADAPAELEIRDGALFVRSARAARGYLDGDIAPIAGADGFVDTGDVVALRGDRYHFAGRRDGTVNVGGQKVHPEEVEAVINRHPGVRMSRVRARANPITGAIVVAEVVVAAAEAAECDAAEAAECNAAEAAKCDTAEAAKCDTAEAAGCNAAEAAECNTAEAAKRDTGDAASTLPDDIRAFCRIHLPPHKVPVSIRIVPSLDIAPSGKLVRRLA
jgi:acyl-CoA synthetase (AMP-forming)/AMP-acid ligase II